MWIKKEGSKFNKRLLYILVKNLELVSRVVDDIWQYSLRTRNVSCVCHTGWQGQKDSNETEVVTFSV